MSLDVLKANRINGQVTIEPNETLYDPVSKFRVSTPENLIDTDFEYGLQTSKWETLELVNNIPTFFAREGQVSLSLANIEATFASNTILVTSSVDHGLTTGSVIVVKGCTLAFADGTYIVLTVPSETTFTYAAKSASPVNGSLLDSSTEIFNASLYQGTEFKLENLGAITTDGEASSTITVATRSPHGFKTGTNFILVNSLTSQEITFNSRLIEPLIYSEIQPTVRMSTSPSSKSNTKFKVTSQLTSAGAEDPGSDGMTEITINGTSTAYSVDFPVDGPFKYFDRSYKSIWVSAKSRVYFTDDVEDPPLASESFFIEGPGLDIFHTVIDSVSLDEEQLEVMSLFRQSTAESLRVRWEGKILGDTSVVPTIIWELFFDSTTDEIRLSLYDDSGLFFAPNAVISAFEAKVLDGSTTVSTLNIPLSKFTQASSSDDVENPNELTFFTAFSDEQTAAVGGVGDYPENFLNFTNTSSYQPYRWVPELANFDVRVGRSTSNWNSNETYESLTSFANKPTEFFACGDTALTEFNRTTNGGNSIAEIRGNVITFANAHNFIDRRPYIYTPGILNGGLVIAGVQRNAPIQFYLRTRGNSGGGNLGYSVGKGIYPYSGSTQNVTASSATNNRLNTVTATTNAIWSGDPVVFNTSIGGLTAGRLYFVKEVPTTTQFTVSETLGGPEVTLTTQTLTVVVNIGGIITDPTKQIVLTNRNLPTTAQTVNFGFNTVTRFPLATDRFGPHAFMASSRIHHYAGANVSGTNPGGWWIALPDIPANTIQNLQPLVFMTSAPTGTTLSTNNFGTAYSTFFARNINSPNHTVNTATNGASVNRTPGNRNYTITGNVASIAANAETISVTATLANIFDDFNGFDLSFDTAAVNTSTNEITFTQPHGLLTGASLTLVIPAGNTAPGGLAANAISFAIVVNATTIALATTLANANAGNRRNITSVGAGSTRRFVSFAIGANTAHYVRINANENNTALVNAEIFDGILTNQTGTTTRTFTIKLIDAAQFTVGAQSNISFRFVGSVDRPFTTLNVSTTPTSSILNLSGAVFDGKVVPIHTNFNNSLTERSEVSTARTWYSKDHGFQSNDIARLNSSTTRVPGGFTNNAYFQIQPTSVDRFRLFTTSSAQIFPTNALGGGLNTGRIEQDIKSVNDDTPFDVTPGNTHRTASYVYSIGAAAAGATSQTITAPVPAYKNASNTTVPVISSGSRLFTVTSSTRLVGGATNVGSTATTTLANGCRIKFFNSLGEPLLLEDGTPFNNVDIRVAGITGSSNISMVCYVITPGGMPANFAAQITNARIIVDPGFSVRETSTNAANSSWTSNYWRSAQDNSVYPFVDSVIVDDREVSGIPKTILNTARVSAVSNASPLSITYTYNGANTVNIASTSRASNFTTITTQTPHGFQEGQSVTIAGVTNTTFNGTFVIQRVSPYTISYPQTAADATSVNGTAAQLVGNMTPRVALIGNGFSKASPARATANAHGLVNRQPFYFIMPPGNSTWSTLYDGKLYYAKRVDANNFDVYKDANLTIPLDTTAFADGYSTGPFAGSVFALGAKLSFNTPLLTYTSRNSNTQSDTIFAPAHGLQSGTVVTYSTGGGVEIGGLSAGQSKFVITPSQDRFRLADNNTGFSTPARSYTQNTTNMAVATGVITTGTHGFSTGSIVQYLATSPASGLLNGGYYYVRAVSATAATLFWTLNGAVNNIASDRVPFFTTGSSTASLRQTTIVDLTTLGTGAQHAVSTPTQIGTLDGLYELDNVAPGGDITKFTLSNPNNAFVPKRTISVSSLISVDLFNDLFNVVGHGLVTGTPIKYIPGGGATTISTLIADETYFAIKVSNDGFRLADTQAAALSGTFITLNDGNLAGSGSHEFTTESIVGAIQAAGTLSLAAGSAVVSGSGTNFTNFYRNGDTFFWAFAPMTNTAVRTVTFVGSTFTNTSAAPFNTAHFLSTGSSVRWNSTATAPAGLVNDGIYYVRFIANNTFSLHPTNADAIANTNAISVSGGTGTHSVRVLTSGSVGSDRIKYVNSATRIVLENDPDIEKWQKVPVTRITTTNATPAIVTVSFAFVPPFPVGTVVRLENTGNAELDGNDWVVTATATNTLTFTALNNLTALTITSPGGGNTNLAGINIYGFSPATFDITSSLLIRSDSASIHRPYDGGVEIVATSSPSAKLIRQTRKYFRYQSGKGIQVSFAINFSPTVSINKIQGLNNGRAAVTTRLPHRVTDGVVINVTGDTSTNYSGNYTVFSVTSDYSFEITISTNTSAVSTGRPEFSVNNWTGAVQRCGIMDDQNGMFFEYDGQELYCVRRNSTEQIGGTSTLQFGENTVTGIDTDYFSELQEGDMIVIKGQSYKVVNVASPSLMFIQPSYRGVDATNVVISKTQELRVARPNWSVDPCDGTGPTGYVLNVNRIQMAYLDYSWYGAGKVRMGFKDQNGIVKYVHEFKHNNIEREAYLRSGNLPARYEVEILENPTFVPSLAHWGTSIIMDGRFDVDDSYLFSATSNPIIANSAQPTNTTVTTINTQTITNVRGGNQIGNEKFFAYDIQGNLLGEVGYALQVTTNNDLYFGLNAGSPITNTSQTPVRTGTLTSTPTSGRVGSGTYLRDVIIGFQNNNGNPIRRNLLVIDKQPNLGLNNAQISVFSSFDFTQFIPLVSVRLAPSVDNGTPGELGVREIINRMQLTLDSIDILSTHECEIQVVFNANLDNFNWRNIGSPSLSEVIFHSLSDTITGGSIVSTFQTPSGGQQVVALNTSQREFALTTVPLNSVTTLGNCILGGNGVYPDGPDVITIRFRYIGLPGLIGPGTVGTAIAPFRLSSRLSWAESQA